jgi:hypothetical protein
MQLLFVIVFGNRTKEIQINKTASTTPQNRKSLFALVSKTFIDPFLFSQSK